MLFGKKRDEKKLPDLPLPKTPFDVNQSVYENHEIDNEGAHSLPAFPDSPTHNKFSQAAIKDAVSTPDEEEEVLEFPVAPQKKSKTVEMKEWRPSIPDEEEEDSFPISDTPPKNEYEHREIKSAIPRYEHPPRIFPTREYREFSKPSPPMRSANSDVFVQIDKFNSAKKSLVKTQETLEQIDELIKRIRETKMREDHELSAWEEDMMHVKAQIKEVSENIFEKLE